VTPGRSRDVRPFARRRRGAVDRLVQGNLSRCCGPLSRISRFLRHPFGPMQGSYRPGAAQRDLQARGRRHALRR
jgi:hypothetical protein